MSTSNKMAIKLGWLPVNIVLLILILLAVSVGVIYQQNSSNQQQHEQTQQYQQQIFTLLTQQLTNGIARWQSQVKQLAQREGEQLLQMTSYEQTLWQQEQLAQFAEADHLCVIYDIPSAPVNDGCLPITYASLEQLRKLQKTGKAEAAYIQAGDASHLLLIERLNAELSSSPILMVAISSEAFKSMIPSALSSKGYVEITQGSGNATAISRYGETQLKVGPAGLQKRIPGSYLRVNYWGEQVTSPMSWLALLMMSAVIVLAWLIQQVWLKVLVRHDADCICQQISDYEDLALKPNYVVALAPLHVVTDAMQRLAALAGKAKTVTPKQQQLIDESQVSETGSDSPQPSIADPTAQVFSNTVPPAHGIQVDDDISDTDAAMFEEQTGDALTDNTETMDLSGDVRVQEESFSTEPIEELVQATAEPEQDNTIEFATSFDESETTETNPNDFARTLFDSGLNESHEVLSDELMSTHKIEEIVEPLAESEIYSETVIDEADSLGVKEEKAEPPAGDVPDALLKLWDKKE